MGKICTTWNNEWIWSCKQIP